MLLVDEREKLNISHKLKVRRIWLDKVLFAILIGLAGFVGNFIFEGYKSDLVKTQFLLDKRLEALQELRVSYSKIGRHAFNEAYQIGHKQPGAYLREVNTYMHILNRWGFLFSDDFNQELSNYGWIHQAAAGKEIQLNFEHWGFVGIGLAHAFDNATRIAMNVEVFGSPTRTETKKFRIQIWTPEDVLVKGTNKLFQDNYKKWQQENAH